VLRIFEPEPQERVQLFFYLPYCIKHRSKYVQESGKKDEKVMNFLCCSWLLGYRCGKWHMKCIAT
jgi:hypothetical protein